MLQEAFHAAGSSGTATSLDPSDSGNDDTIDFGDVSNQAEEDADAANIFEDMTAPVPKYTDAMQDSFGQCGLSESFIESLHDNQGRGHFREGRWEQEMAERKQDAKKRKLKGAGSLRDDIGPNYIATAEAYGCSQRAIKVLWEWNLRFASRIHAALKLQNFNNTIPLMELGGEFENYFDGNGRGIGYQSLMKDFDRILPQVLTTVATTNEAANEALEDVLTIPSWIQNHDIVHEVTYVPVSPKLCCTCKEAF